MPDNVLEQQNVTGYSNPQKNKGMAEIKSLAKLQVDSPDKVKALLNHFGAGLQMYYPNGADLIGNWEPIKNQIFSLGDIPTPHHEKIVRMYQAMKNFSVANQLEDLADAVTSSAYWYWKNIEPDKKAPLEKYATNEGDPSLVKAKKKESISKYIQWGALGLSVLLGGGMLYLAFTKNDKKPKKNKNPVKALNKRSKSVSKDRVRSHRRNGKKPIIVGRKAESGSSLANYRKKYESDKKIAKRKTSSTKKRATRSKSGGLKLKR